MAGRTGGQFKRRVRRHDAVHRSRTGGLPAAGERGKHRIEPDAFGGWRENWRVFYAGVKKDHPAG